MKQHKLQLISFNTEEANKNESRHILYEKVLEPNELKLDVRKKNVEAALNSVEILGRSMRTMFTGC